MRKSLLVVALLLPVSGCVSHRRCSVLRLEAFRLGEQTAEISHELEKAEKLTEPFPKPLPRPRTDFTDFNTPTNRRGAHAPATP